MGLAARRTSRQSGERGLGPPAAGHKHAGAGRRRAKDTRAHVERVPEPRELRPARAPARPHEPPRGALAEKRRVVPLGRVVGVGVDGAEVGLGLVLWRGVRGGETGLLGKTAADGGPC